MYIFQSKSGNQKVAVGTVSEDVRFIEKNGTRRAIVKLKDWRDEELTIFFSNKDGGSGSQQLADRIEKTKLHKGCYIAALIVKGEADTAATGVNFQFSGAYNLTDYDAEGNDVNITVLIGPGCRPRRIKENMYGISMPVRNASGEDDWVSVTFFDNEKSKLAERAEKLFRGERHICCVRGGAIKDREVNGKVYKNLVGYSIEMAPYDEKEA